MPEGTEAAYSVGAKASKMKLDLSDQALGIYFLNGPNPNLRIQKKIILE